MKIFLSYGHDSNAPLIEKIKDYLSKDADGNLRHEVWIDTSEIKAGKDWREKITNGILESDVVLAGLSEHSTRIPGVCRDEISISIGVKGGNIKTILLESSDVVAPPAMISHVQWLDMSDWKEHIEEGFESEYFHEKFRQIAEMVETPDNERFNGEITKLKELLEPISSISRIRSLTEKQMYGREWLYKLIEEWDHQSDKRIFWIVAGPGFGKSTFAANLQERYNARIPAVQFVEWGKPDHSDPCRILKNLSFQLAVRFPEYRTFILQLPEVVNKKLNEKNEDELFDLLFCESTWMKIDGGQEPIWVLIDALDEANDKHGNRIAQTLARHMDRMPQWIKFILTSRDDSKVRLPLQQFKPQVFDLDTSISDNNKNDMLEFVKYELSSLNPTTEQCKHIVDKSDGVFLYAKLVVDDIKRGIYSVNDLSNIPTDINSYYHNLFSRIFQNDMRFYEDYVVKVLEIVLASSRTMHISLVKECAQIESERMFFKALDSLQHLIRIQNNNIIFFHNSLQNWLVDKDSSGCYFISTKDGQHQISQSFAKWLRSDDTTFDEMWKNYHYGFKNCFDNNVALPQGFSRFHMQSIVDMLCPNGSYGFGAIVKYCYEYLGITSTILDYFFVNDTDGNYLSSLVNGFYESIKDLYIQIGIVSPITRTFEWPEDDDMKHKGKLIHDAVKKSAFFCALVEYVVSKSPKSLQNISKQVVLYVEILAFYNRRLGEILLGQIGSLSDMADFTAMEMDRRIEKIKVL